MTILENFLPHLIAKRVSRYRCCPRLGVQMAETLHFAFGIRAWSDFLAARMDLLPDGFANVVETVVDVGANRGDWSDVALRCFKPQRLIAIEPNPAEFSALCDRFASSTKVTCLNIGASSKTGVLPFHVTAASQCASFLKPEDAINNLYGGLFEDTGTIEVRVDPLDVVLGKYEKITLLKIDVQGYERDVLAGAVETLKKTEYVLIEANFVRHYQGDIQFPELDKAMAAHGFVLANLSPPFVKQNLVLWADALYRKA